MRRVLGLVITVATLLLGSPAPAGAAGPTIIGAGSTWSQIAIDQWRADVNRFGLLVNYQGVGSTTGRQFFASGAVDFAVSEIPFQSDDPPVNRAYRYLPVVAGGTSMMYNLHTPSGAQIRDLRLSASTIAGIFTGRIRTWNAPQIRRDYGKPLPNIPIKVIVRSDGSGTSAQFSAYVKAMEPGMWASFTSACGIANTYTSFWPYGLSNCLPNGIGQRGSDGVANYVANPGLGVGAIGYVEAGYAIARRFPVAAVKNQKGTFTLPTAQNVATALQHARLNPDSTQELSGVYHAPERFAYPISSYSYMIVPTDDSISTAKGEVLGKFINYFACTGQQATERLGYSPLPKTLVEFVFDAVKEIPGAPAPPAITGKACPNPTLTGAFYERHSTGPPPGTAQQPESPPNGTGDETTTGGADGSGGGSGSGGVGGAGGGGEVPTTIPGTGITATPVPTLSEEALAQLKQLSDRAILAAQPTNPDMLIWATLALLAAVFIPLIGGLARRGLAAGTRKAVAVIRPGRHALREPRLRTGRDRSV